MSSISTVLFSSLFLSSSFINASSPMDIDVVEDRSFIPSSLKRTLEDISAQGAEAIVENKAPFKKKRLSNNFSSQPERPPLALVHGANLRSMLLVQLFKEPEFLQRTLNALNELNPDRGDLSELMRGDFPELPRSLIALSWAIRLAPTFFANGIAEDPGAVLCLALVGAGQKPTDELNKSLLKTLNKGQSSFIKLLDRQGRLFFDRLISSSSGKEVFAFRLALSFSMNDSKLLTRPMTKFEYSREKIGLEVLKTLLPIPEKAGRNIAFDILRDCNNPYAMTVMRDVLQPFVAEGHKLAKLLKVTLAIRSGQESDLKSIQEFLYTLPQDLYAEQKLEFFRLVEVKFEGSEHILQSLDLLRPLARAGNNRAQIFLANQLFHLATLKNTEESLAIDYIEEGLEYFRARAKTGGEDEKRDFAFALLHYGNEAQLREGSDIYRPWAEEGDEDAQAEIVEALIKLGDTESLEEAAGFLSILDAGEDDTMRYLRVEVLIKLGTKDDLEEAIPLLQDLIAVGWGPSVQRILDECQNNLDLLK